MRTIPKLLSVLALCIPCLSHASEQLLVQVPAVLDPAAPITPAVKSECGVDVLIGNHVLQAVSERFPGASPVKDGTKAGSNKFLKLTILSVYGVGGGAWSGPKSMTIRADLLKNGRVVQSKVLQRTSGGGVFGGLRGTCPIMERIAVTLGKDVALWVSTTMPASAAQLPARPVQTSMDGSAKNGVREAKE